MSDKKRTELKGIANRIAELKAEKIATFYKGDITRGVQVNKELKQAIKDFGKASQSIKANFLKTTNRNV